MSPTKKPSKLSADERAFVDRIRSLNEEETAKLTFEELDRSSIVRRITRLSDLFDSCFLNSGLHFLDRHLSITSTSTANLHDLQFRLIRGERR
jgi:hypothetical protein